MALEILVKAEADGKTSETKMAAAALDPRMVQIVVGRQARRLDRWPIIGSGEIDRKLLASLPGRDVRSNVFQSAKSATSSQITRVRCSERRDCPSPFYNEIMNRVQKYKM